MPTTAQILRLRNHEIARFLNAHRFSIYSLVSFLAVSVVILSALKNYSNFYSVAIHLSKSSRGVLVLANFGVLLGLICGHIVQRIFFGSLRANEVERLYDRLWFFITESLLAFTIFRDEFDTPFVLMFGFLLFVKSFHWLASDRIEWMDQQPYPGPPLLFHFRMGVLFAILWTTDCLMFLFAVEHTLTMGVGGMVLFASEYGILMASVLNTISKYLLSAYDLRRAGRRGGENAPPWENKSMWLFYIELATDFAKLATYLVFFIIIIAFYGIPLNIVRDVYVTARSFVTRLRALHRYQTATRNMDQRYPNATEEELAAMTDRTCIICREEMALPVANEAPAQAEGPNTTPKKLPCGHVFHFHCLRSWLERQQSCPTCRRNVLDSSNTAAPQPPAAAGVPLVDGQQANNPPAGDQPAPVNNNPLGFLARFFVPPRPLQEQPANQPAQDPPAGQRAGIYINYQVQYQFPRDQADNNNEAAPGLQAQPLPPFPGFHGPANVWQPWPADDVPQNPPASQRDGHPVDLVNGGGTSDGPTTTTSQLPAEDAPAISTESTLSPREAAALAALNRLTGGAKTSGSPKTPKSEGQPPSEASMSTSTSTSTSASTLSPTQSFESGSSDTQQRVPNLIPLWHLSPQNILQNPTPPNRTGRNSEVIQSDSVLVNDLLNAASSNLPPLSQLPPTLTSEQLARLDTLTREAIDERLRVLEGVSGAVYRCIDDLMRLRSALPVTAPATQPPPSNSISSSSSGTSKGKAREVPEQPLQEGENKSTEALVE